jgi:hypothetical protein
MSYTINAVGWLLLSTILENEKKSKLTTVVMPRGLMYLFSFFKK